MNARLAALAIGLAALAACNPFGGGVTNPPRTKAGLWTQTVVLGGREHGPAQFCDPGHAVLANQHPDCSQWQASRGPDGALQIDAVCTKFGQTMHIHRRIVGDFAKAYTEDMTGVGGAPDAPPTTLKIHFDYRYLGACPPGMKVAAVQSAEGSKRP